MALLSKYEREMRDTLRTYIQQCNQQLQDVPDNLIKFLDHMDSLEELTSRPDYMLNPIDAFHFVQRMSERWPEVDKIILGDECPLEHPCHRYNVRREKIHGKHGHDVAPSDMIQAALALLRLWKTYKLDLPKLYRGEILNTTTTPLTFDDVLYICNQIHHREEYYNELQWLQALLDSIDTDNLTPDTRVEHRRVVKLIAGVYLTAGLPCQAKEVINKALEIDPESKSLQRDLTYYTMKVGEDKANDSTGVIIQPVYNDIERRHYESLCRGEVHRPANVLSKLCCVYRKTKVPIFRVKEEIYSYEPRLSVFYEVIRDGELKRLKEDANAMLYPSRVVGNVRDTRYVGDYEFRISETAWVRDDEYKIAKHISHRVGLITGLSTRYYTQMAHAEPFQVLNYGIGGFYSQHHDYLDILLHKPKNADVPQTEDLQESGDRISTWMFYLNDVAAGGCTVFTKLNVTIPVVKGAAAFWYNIKRDGNHDRATIHGGCPVLLGSKWVANKWIRQTGQIFRRKCGRTPDAIDTLF